MARIPRTTHIKKVAIFFLLLFPWLFSCQTENVGPNSLPDFDFDPPPGAPSQVVVGSVDQEQADQYLNLLGGANSQGEVTTESQNALADFESELGATDFDFLADMDSTELESLLSEIEQTGQVPAQIESLIAKLADWPFLPTLIASRVEPTSSLPKGTPNSAASTGPFEDCIQQIAEMHEQEVEQANETHDACLQQATDDLEDCRTNLNSRRPQLRDAVSAFCGFAPESLCRAAWATYRITLLANMRACTGLFTSTETACNSVFNDTIQALSDWRVAQEDVCHQSFGG